MKPIWYFVGLILTSMGLIILISGLYFLISGYSSGKVLENLYPNIWWGGLMVIIGLIYIIKNKNIRIK